MKKMLDWLTWLLWSSEIVFLAASTPHIATYFEHFDNPTTFWGNVYSWIVGYGLALTIDGVTFVVLMSLVVAIKYRRPWWLTSFLVFALLLISTLSWFINWQYDIVFSSSTFARADNIAFHGTTIGNLNPLIGGAFPLLSVLYALVAKALEVDESALTKTAMTPEQFANEKLRLQQEQELKTLKASQWNGKGLLSSAKERLIGVSVEGQSEDIDAPVTSDEEDIDALITDNPIDSVVPSDGLASARNIPLEYACQLLECDIRTVKQLLSKGKIKSPGTSGKLITRASIDAYLLIRRRRKVQSEDTQSLIASQSQDIEPSLDDEYQANGNGHNRDTDPLGLPALATE